MDLLIPKLIFTPLLIGWCTWATRRWGHHVGGLLAGLPLTSGPISLFIALEEGPRFAAAAAASTVAGLVAMSLFCLAYARLALNCSILLSLCGSLFVYSAAAAATAALPRLPLAIGFPGTCFLVFIVFAMMPKTPAGLQGAGSGTEGVWPRAAAAAAMLLMLTSFAHALGPMLTGLLSPFPLFAATLAAFAQREEGGPAAAALLRGIVAGSFGFACFFTVVALMLPATIAAYAAAAIVAAAVNLAVWKMTVLSAEDGSSSMAGEDPGRTGPIR